MGYEEQKVIDKQLLAHHLAMSIIGAKSFDKAILGLSTASLGFTFAFLRTTLTNKSIIDWCLLLSTWGCLITSIVATLITFIVVQEHATHRVQYFSSALTEEHTNIESVHWSDKWLTRLQYICAISFVLGLLIFTFFVGINVS